jgi:hypothetical protein
MRTSLRGLLWLTVALVVVVGTASTVVGADKSVLFSLTDPRGDDWGDGSLVYPVGGDLAPIPGDLDLVSLTAREESGGTSFEVELARRVRVPERRTIDEIGTSLDQVARFGFYAFNVDIYIDTDRIPGSGSTTMLPGRRATVAASSAWEKAICLTPRPYDTKDELRATLEREARTQVRKEQGRVDSTDKQAIADGAKREIADSVYFPTLIWVKGNRVSFFVPGSFLGGAASPKWAYVIAITGADITQKLDLGPAIGVSEWKPRPLMMITAVPGKSKDFFGGAPDEDDLYPPLVDIFVPKGMKQEKLLKDYDLRTGRPVALPGVVPAEQ